MFVEDWPSYLVAAQGAPGRRARAGLNAGTMNSRRQLVLEISVVLVMLVAVVLSQAITTVLPFAVPLPLVQIALGALLTTVADLSVPLNPDIFFLSVARDMSGFGSARSVRVSPEGSHAAGGQD